VIQQNFLDVTRRSVAQLKKHWDQSELEIRPPFQRNPVWSEKQKSFLVDTILRGYPIPEIYMQEEVFASGEQRFVIVDGQQRVRACLEFIEGKYGLSEPEGSPWFDKKFDQLTSKEKEQVFGYNFLVRQLPDAPEAQLIDIFKRINRNTVSLNKQELRHATYWGEFIQCADMISNDPLWSEVNIFSANDIRRMLDTEYISEIMVAVLHGPQNKKSTLDKYYVTYEDEFEQQKEIQRVFRLVLPEIATFVAAQPHGRWRKKSDFYSLFLVLTGHVNELPLSSGKRRSISGTLNSFGANVDEYLRDNLQSPPKEVVRYAKAVERAASDIANRKERHEVLSRLLSKSFKSK
jgi:Protein of unknown function DUF262